MDFDIQQKINTQLRPGERVLWVGRPARAFIVRWSDIPLSIFGIFFMTPVLISIVAGLKEDKDVDFLSVFFLPFLLIGLYLAFGRYIFDALGRKRTYYGLTESRIIIMSGWLSPRTRSISLNVVSDITIAEKSSGCGSITLGAPRDGGKWASKFAMPGKDPNAPPMLEEIENVRSVYNQILQTQERTFQGS